MTDPINKVVEVALAGDAAIVRIYALRTREGTAGKK